MNSSSIFSNTIPQFFFYNPSIVKIIQDIISVIGNNQIPLFLILSSKFYKCKTFSKKEVSLSKNINTKLISMSPFVEDNTTIRIKDVAEIDSQESIKVVFSRKDIIQSWVKVLSKLENPKIGISNGYLELTESFFEIDYASIVQVEESVKDKNQLEKILLCEVQKEIYPKLELIFVKLINDPLLFSVTLISFSIKILSISF